MSDMSFQTFAMSCWQSTERQQSAALTKYVSTLQQHYLPTEALAQADLATSALHSILSFSTQFKASANLTCTTDFHLAGTTGFHSVLSGMHYWIVIVAEANSSGPGIDLSQDASSCRTATYLAD